MFVSDRACILHADMDAFYASVAQRDDPALAGRPVIVGGGVVMAASYEARRYGVRGGMGGAQARRLCPDAVIAQPCWSAYLEASRALFAVLHRLAPIVEGLSMEEAFLDVGGVAPAEGSPRAIAVRLRREVREQTGLPVTVGVARTKIVAKMASRAAKPDGLLVVPPHAERAFLHPLQLEQLWGIGPASAAKLHARGLRTVGDVARLSEPELIAILGTGSGRHVHDLSQNRDRRPVQADRRRRSFGAQRAFGRSRRPPDDLDDTIAALVDRVTRRMAGAGDAGRTVLLRLRFEDYSRVTRSYTLPEATAAAAPILAAARTMLAAAMPLVEREGLTCVGVTVANLAGAGSGTQLEFEPLP
jgi:DNA polymerase-4